ncbi:conserved exported hypothetical protein [Gammaproteobacteria bacterium]
MKIQRILISIGACILWCYANGAFADGINQQMPGGLDSKSAAKVARFKAESASMSTGPGTGAAQASNCGSVSIGNVRTTRGGPAPREVTTIVTGDVINVNNGNCR